MLMVPPENAGDKAQYRVAVTLNLNPFIPISYRTCVHRLEGDHESFIGDFEYVVVQLRYRRISHDCADFL